MESTGFFFAAFHTGRNVATTVVTNAIPISTTKERNPNTKRAAPNSVATSALRMPQIALLAIIAKITQSIAIIKDSEKKILKTSKLLAPTALRIPISFFFCEIDTEIKFDNNKAANTARTSPTYKNTWDRDFTMESIISIF